mgnify:CR=1 FL=1
MFGSARGIRIAIDLAGLAIAGGLFIVPTFAAVQAWAGADRRARVVAARQRAQRRLHGRRARVVVALLQMRRRRRRRMLFLLHRRRAASWSPSSIGRTMPASALSDALSIIYRALFRIEVQGLENLAQRRPQRRSSRSTT